MGFAAVREPTANALIRQDMTVTGVGPSVELFKSRIEITNPGASLVEPERFIDSPPRSRNEALASLMRRMGLYEEQGMGIDKVVDAPEEGKDGEEGRKEARGRVQTQGRARFAVPQ